MIPKPTDTILQTLPIRSIHAAKEVQNLTKSGDLKQMRKVAKDFEAVFLSQMLQPMFQDLGAEAPFGGGHGEDVWRSLQVQEYGKAITDAGGIGIADKVMREMIQMQEAR